MQIFICRVFLLNYVGNKYLHDYSFFFWFSRNYLLLGAVPKFRCGNLNQQLSCHSGEDFFFSSLFFILPLWIPGELGTLRMCFSAGAFIFKTKSESAGEHLEIKIFLNHGISKM